MEDNKNTNSVPNDASSQKYRTSAEITVQGTAVNFEGYFRSIRGGRINRRTGCNTSNSRTGRNRYMIIHDLQITMVNSTEQHDRTYKFNCKTPGCNHMRKTQDLKTKECANHLLIFLKLWILEQKEK